MPKIMNKIHVEVDVQFGRIIVLSDDVKSGEVVVDELPFAVGPKNHSGIVCLGCYMHLQFDEDGDSIDRCEKCDWPLCGMCLDSVDHNLECEVFQKANVKFAGNVTADGVCSQLDCITPLRRSKVLHPIGRGRVQMALLKNLTEIEYSPVLGRYLVTSDITNESDILIEEYPFAYGPKISSPVVCLGCCVPVNCGLDNCRCPECKWPLCEECVTSGAEAHQLECNVFRLSKAKFYPIQDEGCNGERKECLQLDCIMPLRVLLNKEIDPERWEREVAPMEYHDQARRKMTEIWNADLINIAKYLRGPCKLDRFSEDLIMRVVGILEVNAFEGRTTHGNTVRCLYPKTGILAHNCVPNTARSIYPSDRFRIRLRAMKNLRAGQQLHHSYTFTLNGTEARQEHIKTGKFFTCRCERCTDPTELGTYFSSFKCITCELGFLSTTDPFDSTADWRCNHCRFQTPAERIQKSVSTMQAEVADVQAMDMSPERLQECEALLRKYRMILHPAHFIQTSLRQSLIEMYGRVHGYEMVELPDILLERKEELCRQVLGVLNVFEPGISRARAMLLYELHVPLVLLAKSGFIAKVLSVANLKERIQEAVNMLDECVSILKYEDTSSQEGILGRVANKALESLRLSLEGMSG